MAAQARLTATRFPAWTLVICAVACVVYITPALGSLLIYDRAAIIHGELWRLVTGNLVHLSPMHLAYDLSGLLITGSIIKIRGYRFFPLLCLSVAVLIGIGIFSLEPAIHFYGGLSGVVIAAATYLCLHGLFEEGVWRWLCTAMLAALTAKMGMELIFGQSFLFATHIEEFVPVPLSHLIGSLTAVTLFASMRVGYKYTQRTMQL